MRAALRLPWAPLLPLLLALAAIIGLELRRWNGDETPMRATPPSTQLHGGASLPARSTTPGTAPDGRREAWVHDILARPLFSPDRRPTAAAGPAPDAPPPALPRVTGIVADGHTRSVLFAGPAHGQVATVGSEINGFKVQAIDADRVTVLGPDGPRVLRPTFDPNRTVPAAPPPPPPSGIPGLPSLAGSGTGIPGLPAPGPSSPGSSPR